MLGKRLLRVKDLNRDVLLPFIRALFRFFDAAAGSQPMPPGLFPGAGLSSSTETIPTGSKVIPTETQLFAGWPPDP
jgi:hypothetical protein